MSFYQLPAEILEQIFRNLDGSSFCSCKKVCKTWNEIVKKLHNERNLWKKFCTQEISDGVMEEILSFKTIHHLSMIFDWADLYKRWHQSRLLEKGKNFIREIQGFCDNPVTCMKTSGAWIITGHSNGFLYTWNQTHRTFWKACVCHLRTITDMALVDLLNLGSYYGSEELHWSHHHIITVSKDSCVRVKSLLEPLNSIKSDTILNVHGDAIYAVRVFGDKFAVSSRDNTITLWNMKVCKNPHLHLAVNLLKKIIGPQDFLLHLGLWSDKLYCISQMGKLNVYDPGKDEWREQPYFKKCLSDVHENRLVIASYFAFRDQIVIMLTAGGKMVVSIDEKHHMTYKLWETLRTTVITVLLQGTILALGGENGKLYLYYVRDNNSLLNLDLSRPSFVELLSEASIVSVDILYDYDSPVVIASTTNSLYTIKWNKNDLSDELSEESGT